MAMSDRVVVIGAGHAGGYVVAELRHAGYAGEIVLIGDESLLPYERPPLSKAWLKSDQPHAVLLRPPAFWEQSGIKVHLSSRATEIQREARRVLLADGQRIAYDKLVIATGSRPRRLLANGADNPLLKPHLHELRSADDADRLRAALGQGRRIAIIGGGYIGLEVAASARALGVKAVVLEREARVLARVAHPALSQFIADYHRDRGVDILTGVELADFEVDAKGFAGVRLIDGRLVPSDCVLVGIGAVPNDDLARAAGIECAQGVSVDLDGRTSDPAIYAIGDVAWRPVPRYDRFNRLESVPNAMEMARRVAARITANPAPAPEVPWFWSDQFDLKLQIAGLTSPADAVVVRGDPALARFALFHLRGDVLQAVEAVNAPPEFVIGRQLIAEQRPVDPARLADPRVPMKAVAV